MAIDTLSVPAPLSSLAGALTLRLALRWDGQQIVAARIASARPLAARILLGQTADTAVALIPRLFSLCGQAQGVAARLALRAARGEPMAEAELDKALRSVALEAIGEHLWRLLLDWPPLLGQAARQDEFVAWRKRLASVKDPAAAARLGAELGLWLNRECSTLIELPLVVSQLEIAPCRSGFTRDRQPLSRVNPLLQNPPNQVNGLLAPILGLAPGPLLPWRTADEWALQAIDETFDEAFAARPSCSGQAAETGALARQSTNAEVAALRRSGFGVAARRTARYADLLDLAQGLIDPGALAGWLGAAPTSENGGLARVETARGVLLHSIELRDNKVEGYVIVAPTEWNFHPEGAFVREITGYPASSRAQAEGAARCLALALDPCVAYEVEIQET